MKKLATIKPKLFHDLLIDIRDRIRTSQTSAVLAVNAEMLRLYWDIGRLIDVRQSAEGWGAAVIPRLATELKNELPELNGFSERNIKRMLAFYRTYPDPIPFVPPAVAQLAPPANLPLSVANSGQSKVQPTAALSQAISKVPPPAALLLSKFIWTVPWSHHIILMEKVKDLAIRVWYFQQTIENGCTTWWDYEFAGSTRRARAEIKSLFDGDRGFDTPKPTLLIQRLISLCVSAEMDDIVLDFFAGSGSTAQAVIEKNISDGTRLKYILCQLPELVESSDFRTIADITKERVRRVITKSEAHQAEQNDIQRGMLKLESADEDFCRLPLDLGFRVYKLDQSNFNTWNANVERDAKAVERQLDLHIDHIRDNRTPEDILYELLLKSGFPLTTPVESVQCSVFSDQQDQTESRKLNTENSTFSIAGGALMICLDGDLTLELIRAIADLKPERVVFLDEGFAGNDQLKANAVQTFKTKGVASFRTV